MSKSLLICSWTMLAFFIAIFHSGCKTLSDPSKVLVDSPTHVAMDIEIPDGYVLVPDELLQNSPGITWIVRSQLEYMIGQLNALGHGVPDPHSTKVTQKVAERYKDGITLITYTATTRLVVHRSEVDKISDLSLSLILPSSAPDFIYRWSDIFSDEPSDDDSGPNFNLIAIEGDTPRSRFYDTYGEKCIRPNVYLGDSWNSFFYYFDPRTKDCPLRDPKYTPDPEIAQRADVIMKVSTDNHQPGTPSSAPEYGKIWEDNRLVITAIFGTSFKIDAQDAGFQAYRDYYRWLRRKNPTKVVRGNQTINPPTDLTVNDRDIGVYFNTSDGRQVIVRIMLVQSLYDLQDDEKRKSIHDWTQVSDFIAYNGHSGYGGSIKDFVALVDRLQKDRYYLFLINGCSSYSYVNSDLEKKIIDANGPGDATKYYDIMMNINLAYFSTFARTMSLVTESLIERRESFYQILQKIGYEDRERGITHQGPIVDGDKTNDTRIDHPRP